MGVREVGQIIVTLIPQQYKAPSLGHSYSHYSTFVFHSEVFPALTWRSGSSSTRVNSPTTSAQLAAIGRLRSPLASSFLNTCSSAPAQLLTSVSHLAIIGPDGHFQAMDKRLFASASARSTNLLPTLQLLGLTNSPSMHAFGVQGISLSNVLLILSKTADQYY